MCNKLSGAVAGLMSVGVACALAEVVVETVPVGNPGNFGEWSGAGVYLYGNVTGVGDNRVCGSVIYLYEISKYEITAGQYTEFLNAVAAADTYNLYNTYMWDGPYPSMIERLGEPGSYSYSVPPDWADRPVGFVAWDDAARFANWMHNGQPTGPQNLSTTEDGSYFLNGATTNPELRNVVRNANATWVLPSEDEWYKAAYHKNDGRTGNYWDFPTQSDISGWGEGGPGNDVLDPDPGNSANFWIWPMDYSIGEPYFRTVVGEFENSPSPYGTFDQGGNQWEWTDSWANALGVPGTKRIRRGGAFYPFTEDRDCLHAAWRMSDFTMAQLGRVGFRLARVANDCNANGLVDPDELVAGTSRDDNFNGVLDECDIAAGASLDCNNNGIPDEVEVGAVAVPPYQWDDGSAETSFGLVDGGYMCWLNQFPIVPGRETIASVYLRFDLDWVPLGAPLTVYIWSNPDNDFSPADAVVLTATAATVTATDSVVDVPDTYVGPPGATFFVGAIMQLAPAWYPASYDFSIDHQTSWLVSSLDLPIDPNNLAAVPENLGMMSDYGYGGNWLVRALPAPAVTPLDCNANGVPDGCDIASGSSPDLNGNGIPDECDPPPTPGDMNCDGAVDALDINPFVLALTNPTAYHSAYPACNIANADCNGDGAINALDINPFVRLLVGR